MGLQQVRGDRSSSSCCSIEHGTTWWDSGLYIGKGGWALYHILYTPTPKLAFLVREVATGVTPLNCRMRYLLLCIGGGEWDLIDFIFTLPHYPPVQVNVFTLAELVLCSILQL